MESTVYHPSANGLAEGAVQKVKLALQAWSPNLNVSFGAFFHRALMTHRNTSKTREKLQLSFFWDAEWEIADFDLWEPILFKADEKMKTVPATFNEGLEHIFHTAQKKLNRNYSSERQPNCKTRRGQCENWTTSGGDHISIRNTTSEHGCWIFTSTAEHQQPGSSEPSRTSTRNINQPERYGELIPTNCLKKEGGFDGFKQTSRNLELFLKFRRTKEKLTWRTLSISNGHKTKLNSISDLALSLSY